MIEGKDICQAAVAPTPAWLVIIAAGSEGQEAVQADKFTESLQEGANVFFLAAGAKGRPLLPDGMDLACTWDRPAMYLCRSGR